MPRYAQQPQDPFKENADVQRDRERICRCIEFVAAKASFPGMSDALRRLAHVIEVGGHWSPSPDEKGTGHVH